MVRLPNKPVLFIWLSIALLGMSIIGVQAAEAATPKSKNANTTHVVTKQSVEAEK